MWFNEWRRAPTDHQLFFIALRLVTCEQKIHHIPSWDDANSDSNSDASAKTHDSLLVHKCGQKRAGAHLLDALGHKGRTGRTSEHHKALKGRKGHAHASHGYVVIYTLPLAVITQNRSSLAIKKTSCKMGSQADSF